MLLLHLADKQKYRIQKLPFENRAIDEAITPMHCIGTVLVFKQSTCSIISATDYGRPEWKKPSLHGRKFNPNPKFLGTTEVYFVCHIGPIFQIALIYAFIGCPESVA